MDHFCLWINNAVGQNNHKYFLGFLFWKAVASVAMIVLLFISLIVYSDKESYFIAKYNSYHYEGRYVWLFCLLMQVPNIFNSYELLKEH